jgi:hypothetical protein
MTYTPSTPRTQQVERNINTSTRTDPNPTDEILRPRAMIAQLREAQEAHNDDGVANSSQPKTSLYSEEARSRKHVSKITGMSLFKLTLRSPPSTKDPGSAVKTLYEHYYIGTVDQLLVPVRSVGGMASGRPDSDEPHRKGRWGFSVDVWFGAITTEMVIRDHHQFSEVLFFWT